MKNTRYILSLIAFAAATIGTFGCGSKADTSTGPVAGSADAPKSVPGDIEGIAGNKNRPNAAPTIDGPEPGKTYPNGYFVKPPPPGKIPTTPGIVGGG